MKERRRLDTELVRRGLFPTRTKARAAVLAGEVFVAGRRAEKAGLLVTPETEIEVKGDPIPFAGRGGIKLEHALTVFGINPAGRIAIDVGASTGGFTDVLLKRGVAHVYAVDVGYGQLAWHLRQDPRVTVMERTNARYLRPDQFPRRPDLATVDVSFISVVKLLPALAQVLTEQCDIVTLIKPQFEAGRHQVGKGGIVRSREAHIQVMTTVAEAAMAAGFAVAGMTYSPITGAAGNLEFFQWWRRPAATTRSGGSPGTVAGDTNLSAWAERVVNEGWQIVFGMTGGDEVG